MLTRIAPILAVAYCTSVHSAQFGAQMPTRSPLLDAEAQQAVASASTVGAQLGVGPAAAGRHVDQRLAVAVRGDRPVEVVADGVAEQRDVGGAAGVGRDGGGCSGHGGGPLRSMRCWPHPATHHPPRPATPGWGGGDPLGFPCSDTLDDARPPRPARSRHRRGPPLARRGYALDTSALEKLLSARNAAIQRGDEAARRAKRVAAAVKGAERRDPPGAGRARPRAEGRGRAPPRTSTGARRPSCRTCCSVSPTCQPTTPPTVPPRTTPRVRTRGEPPAFAPRATTSISASGWDPRLRPRARSSPGPRFASLRGRAPRWSGRWRVTSSTLHTGRHGYTEFRCPRWSTPP